MGALGIGGRIMAWLPLPLVMGMFGGSILGYVTRIVHATVEDFWVAGATVVGYLLGRFLRGLRVPPVGLAVFFGGLAVVATGQWAFVQVSWDLPTLVIPEMSFTFPAFIAVSFPMLVLAMGLGNVQGLGFLIAQGYRVPVNIVTVIVGINSIVNSLLGGHPAIVARTGVAILAAPDAGPPSGRYWANVIAALLTMTIAFAASLVTSLLAILPRSFLLALAGLAILSSFQDALEKAFGSKLRFGSVVAFAVAATPFAFAGITSAFWAVLAGLAASAIVEWEELKSHWSAKQPAVG